MNPDIIVTWPKNCDYPLWRQFLRNERHRFNEIIVAFMEPNTGRDYSSFIRQSVHQDYVHFLDAKIPRGAEDWRNLAVNSALLHSYNADWIWFTEQDFYPRDGFWDEVERLEIEGCDVIAAYQGNRLHPCCIFIKRSTLNKTHKDFGIVPDKSDHFSLIQKDLEDAKVKIGEINPELYFHYNGLSHNYRLATEGMEPNYQFVSGSYVLYKPDEFIDWLKQCLAVKVPLDTEFTEVANAVISKFGG